MAAVGMHKAQEYRQARLALEAGFEYDYHFVGIDGDEELPAETSREVHDILIMFRWLSRAVKTLKPDVDLAGHLEFEGFDGNDESALCAYVRYYVEDLERYDEYRGKELNSHMPVMPMYRRMRRAFLATGHTDGLTLDDLRHIVDARAWDWQPS